MASSIIRKIQQALQDQGFDPGEVDGIWGRRTIAAVKRLQQSKGLAVDGIVGPQTSRALFGPPSAADTAAAAGPLVWYEAALNLVGTREQPGPGSNEVIISWARGCNLDYRSDDIPWCGLFVAHCIALTLPEEPLPANPLGARNWLRFGDACQPREGAVLVFWRNSPSGAFGHVGFYRSEDDQAFHVLGGNQSDSVNTCRVAKARLLGARWPHTAGSLTGSVVKRATATEPLSHNEQ